MCSKCQTSQPKAHRHCRGYPRSIAEPRQWGRSGTQGLALSMIGPVWPLVNGKVLLLYPKEGRCKESCHSWGSLPELFSTYNIQGLDSWQSYYAKRDELRSEAYELRIVLFGMEQRFTPQRSKCQNTSTSTSTSSSSSPSLGRLDDIDKEPKIPMGFWFNS